MPVGHRNVLGAEFVKLRRSLSWSVVILLPVAMVLSGVVNTLLAGEPPADGWHTMWLRSTVFYGLFPLTVGIGILAALAWRVEHQGGNWNWLMSGPTSTLRIVVAKAATVTVLGAVMQLTLFLTVIAVGKLALGIAGPPPAHYLGITGLIAVACFPVAVLQSGLSLFLRSFAAPVAVAFLGAGAAVVLLLAEIPGVGFVLPYALVGRATQLGTGTFADSGTITVTDVGSVFGGSVALGVILLVATSSVLDRRDT